MDTNWDGICTMSIVHFMAYPETMKGEGPVLETISRIAQDDFFSGIEITHIKEPQIRNQARKLIEVSHLQVGYGAQPVLLSQKLDLNSPVETDRMRAVDEIRKCIDEARDMGARRLAVLSGPDPSEDSRKNALGLLKDSLGRLCEHGKDAGIALALETFDDRIDKKCLIGPSPLAARFAADLKNDFPDFGLMYDLSHMPLLDEEAQEALGILKNHLVHIHVGNCVKQAGREGYGDQHPRFGFYGGENDVRELTAFIRALFSCGYLKKEPVENRPFVGFEVKPLPGEASELVIANAKRVWKQAWALA